MNKMSNKVISLNLDVSMVLLLLLATCCQFNFTHSFPVLDPSQIELLIDPLHQAEVSADLESKKVVAKSVFNTPIRTPPPFVNKCPNGQETLEPGGPCVQNLVFVDNNPELVAEITKKFFRDPSNKKKQNKHRHRTSTLRTPTETVPTTTESTTEWTPTTGDTGASSTEFTTSRTAALAEKPPKLPEPVVDVGTLLMPMGSASMSDLSNLSPQPSPNQRQEQQHPTQQNTDQNEMLGTTMRAFAEMSEHQSQNENRSQNHQNQTSKEGNIESATISFPIDSNFEEQVIPITSDHNLTDTNPALTDASVDVDTEDFMSSSEDTMFLLPTDLPTTMTPEKLALDSILEFLEEDSQRSGSITTDEDGGFQISSNDTDTTDYGDEAESDEFDQPPIPKVTANITSMTASEPKSVSPNEDEERVEPAFIISAHATGSNNISDLNSQQIYVSPHTENLTFKVDFKESNTDILADSVPFVTNESFIIPNLKMEAKVHNNETNSTEITDILKPELPIPFPIVLTNHSSFAEKEDKQNATGNVTHLANQTEEPLLPSPLQSTSTSFAPERIVEDDTSEPILMRLEESSTTIVPQPRMAIPLSMSSVQMDEMEQVKEFTTTTTVYLRESPETLHFTGSKSSIDEKLQVSFSDPISPSLRTVPNSESEMNVEFIPSPSDIYKATMPPTIFYDSDRINPDLPHNHNGNNNHNKDANNVHFIFSNIRRNEKKENRHHNHPKHEYHDYDDDDDRHKSPSASILFVQV